MIDKTEYWDCVQRNQGQWSVFNGQIQMANGQDEFFSFSILHRNFLRVSLIPFHFSLTFRVVHKNTHVYTREEQRRREQPATGHPQSLNYPLWACLAYILWNQEENRILIIQILSLSSHLPFSMWISQSSESKVPTYSILVLMSTISRWFIYCSL